MEDTFKVRVDKAFGSLEPSSSPSLNSLWSLTDEEIERNKWIQDKLEPHRDTEDVNRVKIPKFYPPFLQGLVAESSSSKHDMEADIQDLDDDDDDEEEEEEEENGEDEKRKLELSKPDDHNNEEWDIRSSVGMDSTLDNEEEEDVYDKVAVGKEESTELLYMKDVNDYEVDMDSNTQLPTSFTDVIRDPRANRKAAKLRLKEDDESARKLGLKVFENNIQESKQIATELDKRLVMNEPSGSKVVPSFPQSSSSLPDYVRNPSKYTHYTFDSKDDVDEETNQKAFMDLFSSLKGSVAMETQDTPTSIVFTPRKMSSDVSMKKIEVDGYGEKKFVPISIAESEICMMDEDEPEITASKSNSLQKSGRRYRTKGSTHDE